MPRHPPCALNPLTYIKPDTKRIQLLTCGRATRKVGFYLRRLPSVKRHPLLPHPTISAFRNANDGVVYQTLPDIPTGFRSSDRQMARYCGVVRWLHRPPGWQWNQGPIAERRSSRLHDAPQGRCASIAHASSSMLSMSRVAPTRTARTASPGDSSDSSFWNDAGSTTSA